MAEQLDSPRMSMLAGLFCLILVVAGLLLVPGSVTPSGAESSSPAGLARAALAMRAADDAAAVSIDEADLTEAALLPVQTARTGRFLVQVGAFRDRSNAERVAASLEQSLPGFEISIVGGGLHLVLVGPFREQETAASTAWSVEDATGLAPIVVPADLD